MHAVVQRRNQIGRCDLAQQQITDPSKKGGVEHLKRPAMNAQNNSDYESIDHKTSRSICDAVGERLQQRLRPETELPQQLRLLIDQLRRHDGELH
jgi:hypothetical protein